jgi:hypothetical protein
MRNAQSYFVTVWQMLKLAVHLLLKRDRRMFQISEFTPGQPDIYPVPGGAYRTPDQPKDVKNFDSIQNIKYGRLASLRERVRAWLFSYDRQLMLRWSLFSIIALSLFWSIWYLTTGSVPMTPHTIEFDPMLALSLPFAISRWWDVLLAPVFVITLISTLLSMRQRKDAKAVPTLLNGNLMLITIISSLVVGVSSTIFALISVSSSLPKDESAGPLYFFCTVISVLFFGGIPLFVWVKLKDDKYFFGQKFEHNGYINASTYGFSWSLFPAFLIYFGLPNHDFMLCVAAIWLIILAIIAVPFFGIRFTKNNGIVAMISASVPVCLAVSLNYGLVNGLLVGLTLPLVNTVLLLLVWTLIYLAKGAIGVYKWLMVKNTAN